jgi:hypothetical protein
MKFESKAHMAQELLTGKRFAHRGKPDEVIYYDECQINPFRFGDIKMVTVWESWKDDVWEEVKTRHVHQDLIDSYQEGQLWQYRYNVDADWLNITYPSIPCEPDWKEDTQYRLHLYNDLIKAYRNGSEIQVNNHGKWVDTKDPAWYTTCEYRIKPETGTVYEWMFKTKGGDWLIHTSLMTEGDAKKRIICVEYRKTGRSWEVEV